MFRFSRSNKVCRVQNFEIFGNAIEVVSSNAFTATSPNVKVTDIIISNQNVFMIPHGLKKIFPSLVNLAVSRSSLKSVSRKSVAGLEVLSLSGNQIVEIPIDALWDCPDLKILDLNWNEIKNLDENLFIRSPNLIQFEANDNKIEFLHRDLFRDTQKLEVVSLVGNKLRVIDVDFFKIGSILKIDLLQNICVNSTYDSFVFKADQISKFKFHVEIATRCSRAGFCSNSRITQIIKWSLYHACNSRCFPCFSYRHTKSYSCYRQSPIYSIDQMPFVCWVSFVLFEHFVLITFPPSWLETETLLELLGEKLHIVTASKVQHEDLFEACAVNETIERIIAEKIFAQSQKLADPVYLLLISAV